MDNDSNKDSLLEQVLTTEQQYITGVTKHSKYVELSMYEDIQRIEAYANSKHITGEKDSKGRPKPFFNIVTAIENVWYRATDIDRKNIRVKTTKAKKLILSFLATAKLHDWMNKADFGTFLNKWGRALARYGSVVIKSVEKDGKLIIEVVPWNNLIVDPTDFANNLIIQKLELTKAQLYSNKAYDKAMVEELCSSRKARTTLGKQSKDNRNDYITLYEVHGLMPKSYITGLEEDEDVYEQQMHVISNIATKDGRKTTNKQVTLFSSYEDKSPYMLTHLIEEDGRTLSIGAIQSTFDSQWMVNHTAKQIKDQLDLASKLLFQTSDPNFIGQNVVSAADTGTVLVHEINQPLTQVQNNSHDISALQAYSNQWTVNAQSLTSTPDAIRGSTMPSGTAYRQVAILNTESHSLFTIMTQSKGLHLEQLMRLHILPFLKKRELNSSDEISATLSLYGIDKISSLFIEEEAKKEHNKIVKDALLSGNRETLNGLNLEDIKSKISNDISQQGNERFIKPSDIESVTWKELFKDFEWDVDVEVTSENTDKEATLLTLNTVLQTIASNPAILQDPNAKLILNKILEESGRISPAELSTIANTATATPTDVATTIPAPAPQTSP